MSEEVLRAQVEALTNSLRAANNTTQVAQARAAEAEARAERLQKYIADVRVMLRIECAAYDANDWPDDLHLADVVEKYLARSAQNVIRDLERERDRLTAENEHLREVLVLHDAAEAMKRLTPEEVHRLIHWREVTSLVALLSEVARSGVEHDPRIGYVSVQIDRETWDAIAAIVAPPDTYKAVRGVVPAPPEGPNPEEAIRRIRGAVAPILDADGFCQHGVIAGVGCSECDS